MTINWRFVLRRGLAVSILVGVGMVAFVMIGDLIVRFGAVALWEVLQPLVIAVVVFPLSLWAVLEVTTRR